MTVLSRVFQLARDIVEHASHGEIVLTARAGCELSGARRLVASLAIASEPGVGTVVRIQKSL